MTDEELRGWLLTLLFAGHEITASGLAWAFCWSDRLAEVKGKLLQELDTLPVNADPSTITRLPSLLAVCSQTLRLYSIAVTFFARILNTSSYKLFYFISLSIFLSCFKAGVTIATK